MDLKIRTCKKLKILGLIGFSLYIIFATLILELSLGMVIFKSLLLSVILMLVIFIKCKKLNKVNNITFEGKNE